ncbi:hypothetical protein K7H13_06365 [Qipengyuania citrea]|uniref:hypothetical protein n=1 Tax=Qipengyuania citrea TaxID=225971 RepID=UPI001E586EB8|nr:hypothetical protein [Qipengyuania citrea]MCD1590381.1 hypothetical protein [Qipengyuania citrea]
MSTPNVTPPAWSPERDNVGRFKPGQGGRPPGVRNKKPSGALAAIQSLSDEALAQLAALVREKNFAAIRLVLEYTLPRGGRTVDLDGTADPNELIASVTSGEISPDEFARIAQGWKTAAEAADLADIKAQIAELETLVSAMKR